MKDLLTSPLWSPLSRSVPQDNSWIILSQRATQQGFCIHLCGWLLFFYTHAVRICHCYLRRRWLDWALLTRPIDNEHRSNLISCHLRRDPLLPPPPLSPARAHLSTMFTPSPPSFSPQAIFHLHTRCPQTPLPVPHSPDHPARLHTDWSHFSSAPSHLSSPPLPLHYLINSSCFVPDVLLFFAVQLSVPWVTIMILPMKQHVSETVSTLPLQENLSRRDSVNKQHLEVTQQMHYIQQHESVLWKRNSTPKKEKNSSALFIWHLLCYTNHPEVDELRCCCAHR